MYEMAAGVAATALICIFVRAVIKKSLLYYACNAQKVFHLIHHISATIEIKVCAHESVLLFFVATVCLCVIF